MKRYVLYVALNIAGCLQMFAAADFDLSGIEIHDFYEDNVRPEKTVGRTSQLTSVYYDLATNAYNDVLNSELWKRLTEIRDGWQTNCVNETNLLMIADFIKDRELFTDLKKCYAEYKVIEMRAENGEIDEDKREVEHEALKDRWDPPFWREQYADWCRRRCIHLFANLVQKRVAELPSGEKFVAEFSERSRITPGESNLLFSVTHKSDGSCCIEAWTDEVMRKDRKFKDKRNAAEAEVNLREGNESPDCLDR